MDNNEQIARLQRDMRRMKLALVGVSGAFVAALAMGAAPSHSSASFDRITAHRIDIVEPDGTLRAVLTDSAAAPGPIVDGKEGKRNAPLGGLILYNHDGNERGGVGTLGGANGSGGAALLDYRHSEALGMYRKTEKNGDQSAAIFINDPAPPGTPLKKAMTVDRDRIMLDNAGHNAEIVLKDAAGKPRIRLHVDRDNSAHIDVLDESGKVVYRLPR